MELLRDSVPAVSLAVSAAALYARAVASRVRPGFRRLAMLLPVGALFAAVPFAFVSSGILRVTAASFFTWLSMFKVVLLLAAGRGSLDPGFPVVRFLFVAVLAVEVRSGAGGGRPDAASAATSRPSKAAGPMSSLVPCAFKVAVVAAVLHLSHRRLLAVQHLYARYAVYGALIWCFMELLATCMAAAGGALGIEVKPQFVDPHLSTSLTDFWGRRWNLVVSAVLRASVYDPLRRRAGKEAGIMATFLVSGLMHEVVVYCFTLRPPTGELAAFFLLHGACRVAEERCSRRWAARPPRPVAMLLLWGFDTVTSFWLIFPPLCREGGEEMFLKELEAVAAFFAGAGRKLLGGYV
ncbi:hypothetical protein ACP70R_008341 [Stipagrostis hirtigluma subsp. patula]